MMEISQECEHIHHGIKGGEYSYVYFPPSYRYMHRNKLSFRYYIDNYGHFHRNNGPAVIYENGSSGWYQHGKIHRTDGPALFYAPNLFYYLVEDVSIDDIVKEWMIDSGINLSYCHWTSADKVLFKMRFG